MVDIERLWQFWNQALQMHWERRKFETVVRALATVDMALRRVRTKRSRQKVIHTWIALVDQSDIMRTSDGIHEIYRTISEIIQRCGLDVTYMQTEPRIHRQGVHIAIGLSITGQFRRFDLKLFRASYNGWSSQLERLRGL